MLFSVSPSHSPKGTLVPSAQMAPGSVVLGGRRVKVSRPRARSVEGAEVRLGTNAAFADDDLLGQVVMERMLARLATRRHRSANEPVGQAVETQASSTSRSSVSRRFVAGTAKALEDLMGRDLSELAVAALMVDGVHFAENCCVVAEAWRVALRLGSLACLGPTLVVSSSSIISAITRRPTATLMASRPSRAAPATSASCRRSSSDSSDSSVASSRSTGHSFDTVLLTAVPFQSVFLAERPTPTTRQVSGGDRHLTSNKIWESCPASRLGERG